MASGSGCADVHVPCAPSPKTTSKRAPRRRVGLPACPRRTSPAFALQRANTRPAANGRSNRPRMPVLVVRNPPYPMAPMSGGRSDGTAARAAEETRPPADAALASWLPVRPGLRSNRGRGQLEQRRPDARHAPVNSVDPKNGKAGPLGGDPACRCGWSGWRDSNPRPLRPERGRRSPHSLAGRVMAGGRMWTAVNERVWPTLTAAARSQFTPNLGRRECLRRSALKAIVRWAGDPNSRSNVRTIEVSPVAVSSGVRPDWCAWVG
ncbi:hypothetical protein CryarDRAFT_0263 [Cryptosporangium arvum DSM 44712]|uniref:Uncharacterized protein n=1 Tax=Cryptosporangium arvum DSM 44712 TaxID=927661 RepID=A0A010YVS6_9ACTN|nr:hypothetical protein CryarDRAFT_0263 [Cryptosporangium arvum DSM 44712]